VSEADADAAFEAVLSAHPDHAATIRSCMWMGAEDRVDHFKHRHSRRSFTFDRVSGRTEGELDTGEASDDGDAVLANLDTI